MSSTALEQSQLEVIEQMAGLGFTFLEIAEVVAPGDSGSLYTALGTQGAPAYRAFRKGFLESQVKLRQAIFRDALNGSSPAQTIAKKLMDESEYKLT